MYGWNGRKYVQGCMPVYIQEKTAVMYNDETKDRH